MLYCNSIISCGYITMDLFLYVSNFILQSTTNAVAFNFRRDSKG